MTDILIKDTLMKVVTCKGCGLVTVLLPEDGELYDLDVCSQECKEALDEQDEQDDPRTPEEKEAEFGTAEWFKEVQPIEF